MKKNISYATKKIIGKDFYWRIKTSPLPHLDIEITERCNSNCIHCYINLPIDDRDAKKRELSTDKIKTILKEAVELGCMVVRFTGGEPLLREDFEELYVYARKLGLKVILFTNATLITPHLAELFNDIPPLKKIEVSVYGMKESSYEACTRIKGSFKDFKRGIDLLLKHNIPFIVKGTLLPTNKKDMEEFEKWTSTIPWMDKKKPSYSASFDLRSRRDDTKKNDIIKKLRVVPKESLDISKGKQKNHIKSMQEFCSKFMHPSGEYIFSCGSGKDSGCVDSYGNFQPCMLVRHPDLVYDLKKGSLRDAVINFFPKIRKIKAKDPEYLSRCARCFLKGLCEQCPGKSWSEHGTLDTPVEYLCKIAHVQARFLGLIGKSENAWEVKDWKKRIDRFVNKKVF
ncbi:MAG: radical SAM protein [Candidatus Omnitrophota bacterium]